jgi:hypothetical protein
MADEAETIPAPTSEAPAAETPAEGAPSLEEGTILGGDPAPEIVEEPKPEAAIVPEKYELAMPEGVALDEDAFALAEPVFRDIGLSNDQAQKLADAFPGIATKISERAAQAFTDKMTAEVVATRKAWAQEAQALPDVGGANFEASKAHSAKFIDTFGGPDLRTILNDSGLGNHPALFAAFAKAGAQLAEDQDASRGSAQDGKPKNLGEVYYPAST